MEACPPNTEEPTIELELVAGGRPRLAQALRELWSFRGTILAFAERDIRVKYKQAVLGVAWALLQPLAFLAIFTVFSGTLPGSRATSSVGLVQVRGEVPGGLEWSSGFALVGQFGIGGMKADSVGRSVAVSLVELSIRAQYAFMPLNKVRPVVELGGGMYRARSGTANQGIWNASFFSWVVRASTWRSRPR